MHVSVVVEASKPHPASSFFSSLFLCVQVFGFPALHTLFFLELENYLEFWQLRTNLQAHCGNPAKTLLSFQSLLLRAFCCSWTSVFIWYFLVSQLSGSLSNPSSIFPSPLIPNTGSTLLVCSSRMQQNSRNPFQSNIL